MLAGAIADGGEVIGVRLGLCAGLVLGVSTQAGAFVPRPAAETKIGAFVTSLADIQESQRRFDITLWVWLLSPADIGAVDPARTLEITNAVVVDRQYAVTSEVAGGRWSQVKFRATIRAPLDFTHFPFDRHVLRVQLEDAERDLLDQLQLLNIVGLIALAGVSLVLTNFAERRIPAARATQLSQRIGCGWLVGLAILMIGLVALHSA